MLVGLCLDTGHYRFGGGDPAAGLAQHAKRIWHVHFKDCHPCELGKGDVPFRVIQAELQRMGYEGWIVVEQDVLPGMGRPMESAQRNRDYLRSIGF